MLHATFLSTLVLYDGELYDNIPYFCWWHSIWCSFYEVVLDHWQRLPWARRSWLRFLYVRLSTHKFSCAHPIWWVNYGCAPHSERHPYSTAPQLLGVSSRLSCVDRDVSTKAISPCFLHFYSSHPCYLVRWLSLVSKLGAALFTLSLLRNILRMPFSKYTFRLSDDIISLMGKPPNFLCIRPKILSAISLGRGRPWPRMTRRCLIS